MSLQMNVVKEPSGMNVARDPFQTYVMHMYLYLIRPTLIQMHSVLLHPLIVLSHTLYPLPFHSIKYHF